MTHLDHELEPGTGDRPSPGWYRVEHRTARGTTVLAEADECFPHHSSLVRYVSHLRHLGQAMEGELVLVNVVNGEVVARRLLQPEAGGIAP